MHRSLEKTRGYDIFLLVVGTHRLTLSATAQQRPHGQIQCILSIYPMTYLKYLKERLLLLCVELSLLLVHKQMRCLLIVLSLLPRNCQLD